MQVTSSQALVTEMKYSTGSYQRMRQPHKVRNQVSWMSMLKSQRKPRHTHFSISTMQLKLSLHGWVTTLNALLATGLLSDEWWPHCDLYWCFLSWSWLLVPRRLLYMPVWTPALPSYRHHFLLQGISCLLSNPLVGGYRRSPLKVIGVYWQHQHCCSV